MRVELSKEEIEEAVLRYLRKEFGGAWRHHRTYPGQGVAWGSAFFERVPVAPAEPAKVVVDPADPFTDPAVVEEMCAVVGMRYVCGGSNDCDWTGGFVGICEGDLKDAWCPKCGGPVLDRWARYVKELAR